MAPGSSLWRALSQQESTRGSGATRGVDITMRGDVQMRGKRLAERRQRWRKTAMGTGAAVGAIVTVAVAAADGNIGS